MPNLLNYFIANLCKCFAICKKLFDYDKLDVQSSESVVHFTQTFSWSW